MGQQSISTYKLISNLITVKDIADPIEFRISAKTTVEETYQQLLTGLDETPFGLIFDDTGVIGFVVIDDDKFDKYHEAEIGSNMNPIPPSMIISSSTPVIELPKLFENHFFYFLLTNSELTHVVSYAHLDKLPMKFSLFSRFMEFEGELIRRLQQKSISDELAPAFAILPPNRLEAIHKLSIKKYGEDTDDPWKLLHCTNFVDIKMLVRFFPEILNRLPFETHHDYDEFFATLENLRNKIAHSESIMSLLREPKKFSSFVQELETAIDSLQEE